MAAARPRVSTNRIKPSSDFQIALPLAVAQIVIAPDSPVPINEQICRALRVAIVSGDLPVGTLLPTSRELAQVLGVGRNTVVAAYSRLAAESYVHSKFRRGTRVAPLPQTTSLSVQEPAKAAAVDHSEPPIRIGYQGQRAFEPLVAGTGAMPELSSPDPALYPRAILGRLLTDAFGRAHLGESESQNDWRRFQEAVAAHFRQSRGVNCAPSQIVPVSGASAALDLVARLLVDPGHAVLVEDPAPDFVWSAFHAAGSRLYPLPCDSNGADPARANAPPPRLIYVSPSLNFPCGVQMSPARRTALLDMARASGAAIFEFDGYAELLFTGSRHGAMQGRDSDNRVFYFGSLKNTLGPHICVGFLVVPPNLSQPFSQFAQRVGCVPEGFVLTAIASLIESNQYALHAKKIRAAYAQRLKLLVETCRRLLPDTIATEPHGGFHLLLHLPEGIAAEAVAVAGAKQGLSVAPLSRFSLKGQPSNRLVLGFGAVPDRLIETAVRRLGTIIAESRDPAVRETPAEPVS